MGIRGLTTYMKCRSYYLQDFELENTYLVIDGTSICYQIYYKYVNTTSLFGGEYNEYEEVILNFFDNLLACKVTPLVLLDGGNDILKTNTILRRCKERHETLWSCVNNVRDEKCSPLHSLTIFRQALRKKNIRHAQCLSEADGVVASVAKLLNCPVLSFDSDFYIYGTLYIPFDTLSSLITRFSDNRKVIRCKLYRQQSLLNSFLGLEHHTLCLAAIILGDEKISPAMVKNVVYKIYKKLKPTNFVQMTFQWLSERTVDAAITEILSGIPKSMRQQILDIIESIINDYTCINIPAEVLVPLSISNYTMESTMIYKFKGDIENITFSGLYKEHTFKTIGNEKEELNEIQNILIEHRNAQNGNNSIINKLPTWFINEMVLGKFSSSLFTMLDKHAIIFPCQIEDIKRPTSCMITLNIIRVMYGLLSSIEDKKTYMKYLFRDENQNLIIKDLEGTYTATVQLKNLRQLPMIKRKDILDDTLGVKNIKCIDELLPEWKLYIACIKYWSDQEKLYKSDKCYAYSIILCILYHICCTTKFSKNKTQTHNCEPNDSENTVIEAYRKIDVMNCTSAAQYFTRLSQVQKRILYMKKFHVSIVHVFAQFQICLLYAMDLNGLLGCPYEEPFIADLFNGTLLYNLYTDLQIHKDIPKYINQVFKDSPTILTMFNILISKVNPLLE